MKTAKISLAFFSPTGSTKRVLERMGKRWTEDYEAVMQEINLTKLETEQEKFLFGEQELVFFGTPSFGGRVPQVAARRFSNMKGSNTPAVLVVTYGNRAYEDTLLELRDIVRRNGFVPVAAAAVVRNIPFFMRSQKEDQMTTTAAKYGILQERYRKPWIILKISAAALHFLFRETSPTENTKVCRSARKPAKRA